MSHDISNRHGSGDDGSTVVQRSVAPGKRTLSGALPASTAGAPVQRKEAATTSAPTAVGPDDPFGLHLADRAGAAVQLAGDGGAATDDHVVATAQAGLAGAAQGLPHGAAIQQAFGRHDVSGIEAHVGGPATAASHSMGAVAYATGNAVAFQREPDLHTAAHEAAHVVQQRAGVSFRGVGRAGDAYEQHADQVADAVVAGRSAESLLDQMAGGGGGGTAVQRIEDMALAGPQIVAEGKAADKAARDASDKTPVAELAIHADTETVDRTKLTLAELQAARVGHSWITLKYKDPSKVPAAVGAPTKGLLQAGGTAMGFWPLVFRARQWQPDGTPTNPAMQGRLARGETPGGGASNDAAHRGFSMNPFKSVPGRVEEPDTAHTAKASKTYEVTQFEVDKLLAYADGKRGANYNLYSFNCTTFAIQAVEATGHGAPSGAMFGLVALPNALYADILQMKVDGDPDATTTPLGTVGRPPVAETETTPSPSKR